MKKIIIIVAAVLAACLALCGGVAIYNNTPQVAAKNAIAGTFEELAQREEFQPVLDMLQKGSLDIKANVDTSKMDEKVIEEMGDFSATAEVGGKIYFGEEEIYLENLHLNANIPDKEFKFSADAYLGTEYGYISNDEILGGTYGFVKGEMTDAFKNSVWADELDQETYDMVVSFLEKLESTDTKELSKDAQKLIDNYYDFITKSIAKHAEFEKKTKDVKVGGEKVKSRVITVTIDNDTIINVVKDLYEEVKEDEDLREFVVSNIEEVKETLTSYIPMPEEYADKDIDDLYDDLIDQMGDYMDEFEEEMDSVKTKVVIEVVTNPMSSNMRKLTVKIKESGKSMELFSLDLGVEGIKDTNLIQLTIAENRVFTYEIEKNDSKYYESKLTTGRLTGDGDIEGEAVIFKLDIDRRDESYSLKIMEDEVKVSGALIVDGKTTTITVNSLEIEGEKISKGYEISLIINTKDKMPDPKDAEDVTTVFELTKEALEEMVKKAEELIEDFV